MRKVTNTFGDYIFKKRKDLGLTLREFCRKFGYQPSYISRLENSILPAPSNKKKLSALALALGIDKETEDWVTLFSLAASSRVSIPEDVKKDFPQITKLLPAFFRTTRKEKITKKDIENLVELIYDEHNS